MIETRALARSYRDLHALRGIDLRVDEGDVYGFIGPNGAGKTTTIRILTTMLEPTSGDAWVAGHDVRTAKEPIRRAIGYMPDSFGLYPDMTVDEYLRFFAAAYGIPHREHAGLIGGLLELTDLTHKQSAVIGALSRGMQQRLGLARTLVHDPAVLILDEPASGLDPRARVDIRDILRELRRMGKTILLSSHILSELQEVCTRIGVLAAGRLVAQGTLDEVLADARPHARLRVVTDDDPRAAVVLRELPGVVRATHDADAAEVTVEAARDLPPEQVSRHVLDRGLALRELRALKPSLEEVFMALTRDEAP